MVPQPQPLQALGLGCWAGTTDAGDFPADTVSAGTGPFSAATSTPANATVNNGNLPFA